MIKIKSLFTDWHESTYEQAEEYAIHLFTKSNCNEPLKIVEKRIKGITFTEDELLERIRSRRKKSI